MAVYTHLTHDDIAAFLRDYDIGALSDARPIAEGIENTNYFLTTDQGKYILTLFERRTKIEDLPYFTTLMEHLHQRGVVCPEPIHRRDGRMLSALKEKPALIVTFLEGQGVGVIRQEHLLQLGEMVAKMHLAGQDFPHTRENTLSISGWKQLIETIGRRADEIEPGLTDLIHAEYDFLRDHWPHNLPSGPVHADLFPDNVFFTRERGSARLTGIIDFYFACNDSWAYDLAICINAWCFDDRHRFVKERAEALTHYYNDVRPITPEEDRAFPILLRGAALRFLLTRTHDWLFHDAEAIVTRKDPLEYVAKLKFFQQLPG